MRRETFEGRIHVGLEQDRTGGASYASQAVALAPGGRDWARYAFTLTPDRDDPLAKLVILFEGQGTFWLDQVSLMPGDAVDGVRRDVFEKVKTLRPAFIRWPGGNVAQDYHWRWGVGPRDERPSWVNLSWNNELEPSDFGTDEFLRFCRNLGAEPHLVVNVEGRGATVEEAADWVRYAKPLGVKFWEIGNEIWGDWVRGHSDAETYARNYVRYAAAIRAVDPQARLIAVGDNDMAWNRTVLDRAAAGIDYLAVHHYYGLGEMAGDASNLMARPLHYERFYRELGLLLRERSPGKPIKLAINEWNTSLPVPRQHSMESALYAARLMNVFERSSAIVELTAVSDLVNGWSGGVIQASSHGVFVTPTYLAIQLYNDHLGAQRLATKRDEPDLRHLARGPRGALPGRGVEPLERWRTRLREGSEHEPRARAHDHGDGDAGNWTWSPRATVATLTARCTTSHAANSFATAGSPSTVTRSRASSSGEIASR